jgi:hypothetical protein
MHARAGSSVVALELLACASSALKRRGRTLYWSIAWPGSCDLRPPAVLHPDLRDHVHAWSRRWVARRVAPAANEAWWRRDIRDGFLPYDPDPGPEGIPHRSPFLDPQFIRFALNLPADARFDRTLATPYHRRKAVVVRLYPSAVRRALPPSKQYYARTVRAVRTSTKVDLPHSRSAGLLARLPTAADPPEVVDALSRIEHWLAEATARGAVISD